MEKDFVVVLVFIFIVVFAILIIYRSISVFLFLQDKNIPAQGKKDLPLESGQYEKKTEINDEYRQIIEKSKAEYEAFMKNKATGP